MYDARVLINVSEEKKKNEISFADIDMRLRSLTLQVRELNKGNIEASDSQKEELFFDFLSNAISIFQQVRDVECLKESQQFLLPLICDILNYYADNGVPVPEDVLKRLLEK